MNHNRSVVVFTLTSTLILLAGSICATVFHLDFLSFKNINLIADVVHEKVAPDAPVVAAVQATSSMSAPVSSMTQMPAVAFDQYMLQKTLVHFNDDTTRPALPMLMEKFQKLKNGDKAKVRIAWLGDSMIEGDLVTQTFRKQLQQIFGGYGVGFVPAQSVTAQYRTTVKHSWNGDWTEETFKDKALTAPLFFSGHTFFTENGTITLTDATSKDSTRILDKYLICGKADGKVSIEVNGQQRDFTANNKINRILLDSSNKAAVSLKINNKKLPVYGMSMEPQRGVVVDNFSFRGITGLELGKIDTTVLQQMSNENDYDLVVMEYGANLMFRPDDKDYSWYEKKMEAVIKQLRKSMPNTEFLIVSTADRAFRYNDVWQSAVGIDSLVKTQAELAFHNNTAFYNMYASMGGANTIVNWAAASPSLANKDYIHPNQRGAEILGKLLSDAFVKEYNKIQTKPAVTAQGPAATQNVRNRK
ncbi:SGNH/GDSL hydrolase family protein [Taibaiella soli]|uniref:SGNH hydrolase-type esterase domain-containing protein n=1 Tax=Taibaiella soli TaxID=1649169 RepID=A0A2W2ANB0_9BACT|nr:hypothetical protein [Taibaiella soli]PZF73820.1 hypothetical protein DN068_05615 [Taibaiella soli]